MKKIILLITCITVITLLISGCPNIFSAKKIKLDSNPDIPENYGSVRISLVQGSARAVLPSLVFDNDMFNIEYIFEKDNEDVAFVELSNHLFALEAGTYTVKVNIYIANKETAEENLAAAGESEAFTVITGKQIEKPIIVQMRPFRTGDGKGTLELNIHNSLSSFEPFFYLSPLFYDHIVPRHFNNQNFTRLNNETWSIEVPVGYYFVTASNDLEIVHIYQNLITYVEITYNNFEIFTVTKNDDYLDGDSAEDPIEDTLRHIINLIDTADDDIDYVIIQFALENDKAIKLKSRLYIPTNKNIIIIGDGITLERDEEHEDLFFSVNYSSLTLTTTTAGGKFIINGQLLNTDEEKVSTNSIINVENNGTLIMEEGVILTGNLTYEKGSGVSVNNYSIFRMYGGTITNNKSNDTGGGVYVDVTGEFFMEGGEISLNEALDEGVKGIGGGVFVDANTYSAGLFIKNGGSIYGEDDNKNIAYTESGWDPEIIINTTPPGHAVSVKVYKGDVYAHSSTYDSYKYLNKNTTSGPDNCLDSRNELGG